MKLAALVEFFPPKLGSDRRIYEIMSRLASKHEIHFVVAPPFRALSGNFMIGNKELDLHFKGEENRVVNSGISGHFIQIPRLLTKIWTRSYEIAYFLTLVVLCPKIIKSLRKINPEIIVLNYPSVYTGILGFAAGKILRRPVLLDFNDLIAQYSILILNTKSSSLKTRLFVFVQDFLARNCNKVVATTRFIRNYAIKHGASEEKVFVISNGVDTKFFSPKTHDVGNIKTKFGLTGKTICLYSGRFDGWAGIDIIMQLCDELKDKCRETQFLIVGGKLVNRKYPKNLVVVGERTYEEMPEILNVANVILVPFPNNVVSHATSPLKLFEGMAMEKPVVASRVEGIEEVITNGKNGVLVDNPNSIQKWCEAVGSILNSRALAKRVAEKARHTVIKKYDWNQLAEEYEKIFIL